MTINEKLVKLNYSSRKNTPILYIVIHDTGNTSRGANAETHFHYFNNADRGASAHYFVDDKQILRIIKDEDKSWHCGDGHGKYGITNENSIGIEMCINADGDENKTYQATVELTKHLMNQYNIPVERVVRHYDASRKICPYTWNKNNWAKWQQFKQDITDYKPTIKLLYKNLLNREPDADGLNYWNNQLCTGVSLGELLKAMGDSEEFKSIYL